jgi:Ni/Co efflux regulator RcnB
MHKLKQKLNFLSSSWIHQRATETRNARSLAAVSTEYQMKNVLMAGVAVLLLSTPTAFAQREDEHGGPRFAQNEVRGTPHWARGDRLPEEFRGDRYTVSDWRALHLRRPEHGFHWVHIGDRYLLIGERNGMIREFRMEHEIHH